jgi:hypothetical protein
VYDDPVGPVEMGLDQARRCLIEKGVARSPEGKSKIFPRYFMPLFAARRLAFTTQPLGEVFSCFLRLGLEQAISPGSDKCVGQMQNPLQIFPCRPEVTPLQVRIGFQSCDTGSRQKRTKLLTPGCLLRMTPDSLTNQAGISECPVEQASGPALQVRIFGAEQPENPPVAEDDGRRPATSRQSVQEFFQPIKAARSNHGRKQDSFQSGFFRPLAEPLRFRQIRQEVFAELRTEIDSPQITGREKLPHPIEAQIAGIDRELNGLGKSDAVLQRHSLQLRFRAGGKWRGLIKTPRHENG